MVNFALQTRKISQNHDFFIKNQAKSLIFHGFPCQNFPTVNPSSRHAYCGLVRARRRIGGGAASGGVGAGHIGIGAVVDIQQRALRPFEQDALAVAVGLIQQTPDRLTRILQDLRRNGHQLGLERGRIEQVEAQGVGPVPRLLRCSPAGQCAAASGVPVRAHRHRVPGQPQRHDHAGPHSGQRHRRRRPAHRRDRSAGLDHLRMRCG